MTAQTLNGQIIGETERAIRAVLDRLLDRCDTTFEEWVLLNSVAIGGGAVASDELRTTVATALRVDEETIQATVDALTRRGLLDTVPSDGGPRVGLTAAGRERHGEIRAGIAEVSARLYGDLPAEDLATAARVLTTVQARATAVLEAT